MARRRWMPLAIVLLLASPVSAQSPSPGQTLISTANGNDTHLMELDGTVVQTWTGSYRPSSFAYLLDGGSVLRPTFDFNGSFSGGGIGGRIQRIDSTNTIVWDYYFSTSDYQQHHDIEPMPNGNLLIVAWERKSNAEAIAAGRQGIYGEIWPTLIAEVMPQGATGGTVVWEWHFWDHIIQDVDPAKPNYGVVADHPELLDLNYGSVSGGGDWVHVNSIDYDPVHDQIVFSSRSLNEVYVIDHSTTTAEAAGHTGGNSGMGGDILYRWGNPQAYDRGTSSDREFDVVHGANFIDEGHPGTSNILAFNNGDRPGFNDDYSSVFEIDPPRNGFGFDIAPGEPFGPAAPVWSYGGPGDFYGGPTHCGAHRLPNGNTLITAKAQGRVFEVTSAGQEVWEYVHPGGVNRALRYPDPATAVVETGPAAPRPVELRPAVPNPFRDLTRLEFVVSGDDRAPVSVEVISVTGARIALLREGHYAAGRYDITWDGRDGRGRPAASGVYFVRLRTGTDESIRRIVRVK